MIGAENFRSAAIVQKTVTLADGKEHVLHFKEVSASVYELVLAAMRSKDATEREDGIPRLIAAALCTADGAPVLTHEQAAQLKPGVSMALANAALEVNPATYAGNDSTPGAKSGSGKPSPSRSADEASPSGSA